MWPKQACLHQKSIHTALIGFFASDTPKGGLLVLKVFWSLELRSPLGTLTTTVSKLPDVEHSQKSHALDEVLVITKQDVHPKWILLRNL